MVEKVFRVMSNSQEYLTADTIAMALLRQITLDPKGQGAIFGVMELEKEGSDWDGYEECAISNRQM